MRIWTFVIFKENGVNELPAFIYSSSVSVLSMVWVLNDPEPMSNTGTRQEYTK